jgi:hypothetical protein
MKYKATIKDIRHCRSGLHKYDHVFYRTCPHCQFHTRAQWRVDNQEHINRYQRRWRKKNPEKIAEYNKTRREFNAKWGAETWKKWMSK